MRLVHLLVPLLCACQGDRGPPPVEATAPLQISSDADRRTISLNPLLVPAVTQQCAPGQLVQKSEDGWACVTSPQATLDGMDQRLAALERGPTSFVSARVCAAEDPGANLAWESGCALSRGTTAQDVILHCPVVVTSALDRGIPAWTRLSVFGEDASSPAADSSATVQLLAGDATGLRAIPEADLEIGPVANPQTKAFASPMLTQLLEVRVVLRTSAVSPGFRPARFCGFGLGPT